MAQFLKDIGSNNTNKLSPQEQSIFLYLAFNSSNNTNKLSPQERLITSMSGTYVQIIQINLALKN